jgi:Trk K+ transport system NAD-binding subunit
VISGFDSPEGEYDIRWLTDLSHIGMIRETTANTIDGVGQTVGSIEATLPPRCFIGSVKRYGTYLTPVESLRLEQDDTVYIIGRDDTVSELF